MRIASRQELLDPGGKALRRRLVGWIPTDLLSVEQSGHDRRRALLLNVWYSAGLMSVFLLLAGLAVSLGFGWGHLFKFSGFSVALAAIVFAMGLSFLGVWEIPIPGFMGSGTANELAAREGPAGAFFKGVVTTILATPCCGPGLATALAWCGGKPIPVVYAVFTVMGLGMALTEEYVTEEGVPQTLRWKDYPIPLFRHIPEMHVHIVEHPTLEGPYGAKGIGELPSIPTAPAICNAIYNAVGVCVQRLPVKPAWLVREVEKHNERPD